MSDFIATAQATHPDIAGEYAKLEDLNSKKLWAQLTDALLSFVRDPKNSRGDNFLQLYDRFVAPVETKLNQVRVVQFVALAARQYYPSMPYIPAEVDRALDLLDRQLSRRSAKAGSEERLGDEAFLLCSMEMACLKVRKAGGMAAAGAPVESVTTLLDDVKASLAKGKTLMEGPSITGGAGGGADPAVFASFYRASLEYYKLKGPPHLFYSNALLFLGNTPIEHLSNEERLSLAVDVALAALIGEGVFDFGEVNAHPLLQPTLNASPAHAWLGQLLRAFQAGDIDAFNAIVGSNKAAFDAAPALSASSALLKEKVTLLAVMELAAKRSDRGAISFEEIAAATRLPQDQVEWVLMRAFSLGLMKGSIDQVERTAAITFVRPRVLDAAQVVALRDRLAAWRDKTGTVLQFVEERTSEVLKA